MALLWNEQIEFFAVFKENLQNNSKCRLQATHARRMPYCQSPAYERIQEGPNFDEPCERSAGRHQCWGVDFMDPLMDP